MPEGDFHTESGRTIPAVTATEMAAVDRVATQEVGLALLQMMENAGRNMAVAVHRVVEPSDGVVVLAGDGGNGGGGLACARHLANIGFSVEVVLDRPAADLTGAAAKQHGILESMAVPSSANPGRLPSGVLVVDALVGYGLSGPLRGPAATLVERLDRARKVFSLDVPSGRDATTGEVPGPGVDPDCVVTLALPKTGLTGLECPLLLSDIAIPTVVYDTLDILVEPLFSGEYLVEIREGE